MVLPADGFVQQVEFVVGGSLPRAGFVQPVEVVGGSGFVTGGGAANQVAYWSGATSLTGSSSFVVNPATPSFSVGGITLSSGAGARFVESDDGASAAVSGAATGRLRYNNTAGAWQVSVQGGAYANLLTGAGGTFFSQGGNAFATSATLGTTDAFDLQFIRGGANHTRLALNPNTSNGPILLVGTSTSDINNTTIIQARRDQNRATIVMVENNSNSASQTEATFAAIIDPGTRGLACFALGSAFQAMNGYGPLEVVYGTLGVMAGLVMRSGSSAPIRFVIDKGAGGGIPPAGEVARFDPEFGALLINTTSSLVSERFNLNGLAVFQGNVYLGTSAVAGIIDVTNKRIGFGLSNPVKTFAVRHDVAGTSVGIIIDNRNATGNPMFRMGNDPENANTGFSIDYYNADNSTRISCGGAGGISMTAPDGKLEFSTSTVTRLTISTSGTTTFSGARMGFFGATAVAQPAVTAFTNSVTVGGTSNTLTDYADLTVYASDASTIRNNIYQLGLSVSQCKAALRSLGLGG